MATKQIYIKDNIKNFDSNMLKLDKKTVLNNTVYYIG